MPLLVGKMISLGHCVAFTTTWQGVHLAQAGANATRFSESYWDQQHRQNTLRVLAKPEHLPTRATPTRSCPSGLLSNWAPQRLTTGIGSDIRLQLPQWIWLHSEPNNLSLRLEKKKSTTSGFEVMSNQYISALKYTLGKIYFDKESSCNAGDPGLIPCSGRSPGEGNGNSLQYSCLENSMDRGNLVGYSSWGSQRARHNWETITHLGKNWAVGNTYVLSIYILPSPLFLSSPLPWSLLHPPGLYFTLKICEPPKKMIPIDYNLVSFWRRK